MKARMTQIKTFTDSDNDKLDKNVNEWVKEQTANRRNTGFSTLDTSIGVCGSSGVFWCSVTYAVDAPDIGMGGVNHE